MPPSVGDAAQCWSGASVNPLHLGWSHEIVSGPYWVTGPHPIIHLWISLETEATTVDLSKLRLSSTQLHGLLILVVDLLLQVHVWFDMVWCNEKTVALTRRGGHGVNPVLPTASNPSTSAWQCRLQFSEALLPSRCCSQLLRDVNFHRWNAWCPHISAISRPCPFRNASNIEFVCWDLFPLPLPGCCMTVAWQARITAAVHSPQPSERRSSSTKLWWNRTWDVSASTAWEQ